MLQKVVGKMRKAIEDYNMIEDGDKIAVGLSGGKDSITLLNALNNLRRYYSKHFDIIAITIHPGGENFNTDNLKKMCDELGIEYIVYMSNIFEVVFDIRKEKSPCSLCANLRRGMLNSLAIEHGCNKIALGHHMDDVIETAIMNLFLNGNFNTFAPVTYLSRSDVKTIRPLIYVSEKELRATARENNYPVMQKCCPKDGFTKREYVKNLIADTQKEMHDIKKNMFGAIKRSNIKGWNKEILKKSKKVLDIIYFICYNMDVGRNKYIQNFEY